MKHSGFKTPPRKGRLTFNQIFNIQEQSNDSVAAHKFQSAIDSTLTTKDDDDPLDFDFLSKEPSTSKVSSKSKSSGSLSSTLKQLKNLKKYTHANNSVDILNTGNVEISSSFNSSVTSSGKKDIIEIIEDSPEKSTFKDLVKPRSKRPSQAPLKVQSAPELVSKKRKQEDPPKNSKRKRVEKEEMGEKKMKTVRAVAELWVDKYRPQDQNTLSVAKKKYQAVVDTLTKAFKGEIRMILLVGPPGSGKTATIDVITKKANIEVVQWTNPTHRSYCDLNQNDCCRTEKENVLSPFVNFLQREKYPAISFVVNSNIRHKLVVIEDLPYLHSGKQHEEFQMAVSSLIVNAKVAVPCVFIISNQTEGSSEIHQLFSPDTLDNPKVAVIRFNPITSMAMKKTLNRIVDQERATSRLDTKTLDLILESSNGDIRSAINTAQFHAVKKFSDGNPPTTFLRKKNSRIKPVVPKNGKKEKKKSGNNNSGSEFSSARDFSLSLFHSLGKVLYNKRNEPTGGTTISDTYSIAPEFQRNPMKSDPAEFYKHVHMDSSLFNQFLGENYLKFFSDVDDVTKASAYISDSDLLCSSSVWMGTDQGVVDRYAWAVTARGLMFSNTHPAPWSYMPLVKPHQTTINHTRKNNQDILDHMHRSFGNGKSESVVTLTADILPYLAMLSRRKKITYGLTPSQQSFLNMMTSYSSTKQESNATRGSEYLTEYDNHYKDYFKQKKENERRNTINLNIDDETKKTMMNNLLKGDDIEEIDD